MLQEFDAEYEVIDVTERPEILEKYPIMTAPGIVIDEKLGFVGVPWKERVARQTPKHKVDDVKTSNIVVVDRKK